MGPTAAIVSELQNVDVELILEPSRHQCAMAPAWVGRRFFVAQERRCPAVGERRDIAQDLRWVESGQLAHVEVAKLVVACGFEPCARRQRAVGLETALATRAAARDADACLVVAAMSLSAAPASLAATTNPTRPE